MQDSTTIDAVRDARRLGELLQMISDTAIIIAKRSADPQASVIVALARELKVLADKFGALPFEENEIRDGC